MSFASTPDGIHLYYETVGRGEPVLLVGDETATIIFGISSAGTLPNGIKSSFTISAAPVKATSRSSRLIPPESSHAMPSPFWIISKFDGHMPTGFQWAEPSASGWVSIMPIELERWCWLAPQQALRMESRPPPEIRAIISGEDNAQALALMFSKRLGPNQLRFFFSMRESNQHPTPYFLQRPSYVLHRISPASE